MRPVTLAAVLFFIFICWIIVQADRGADNFFIDHIRAIPYGDKFGHIGLYGLLALLVDLALLQRRTSFFEMPLGCALVLAFALIEELSQGFLPSRTVDIGDAISDCLGVYLAAWLSSLLVLESTRECKKTIGT